MIKDLKPRWKTGRRKDTFEAFEALKALEAIEASEEQRVIKAFHKY